jgi:hypothetical protein
MKSQSDFDKREGKSNLLFIIAAILIVLWITGIVTSFTMGGFIHILIVIAIIMVLIRIITGRKIL